MKKEIEARLLECDFNSFIVKLKECNAEFVGDFLQIRKCFDFTPVRENSWIRLRTTGKETTLTIKEIVDSGVSGTNETEIVVSDFATTEEILNKLGYIARTTQENRRVRYMLDNVEIDIDFWPFIPTYVEFEAETEQEIVNVCSKLGIDYKSLVTMDVTSIYNHYGINLDNYPTLVLENERKA